jgi:hypothetical protein
VKPNTSKKDCEINPSKHKICIIGDSHVKGLSDKVSSGLDDTFSVSGITKPNGDIEGITFST